MRSLRASGKKGVFQWEYLVGIFVVLIVVQGALRKWIFPGLERYLYFLKDGVLALAFGAFLMQHKIRFPVPVRRTPLPLLLGVFAGWVVLQSANPRLPRLSVGLLGLRSHLFYVSLTIMVPVALTTVRDPMRLVRGFVIGVAVPILLLGIYQYFQEPTAWINRYVAGEAQVTDIAGHARITGTFSYITGMSTFLILSLCSGIGLLFAGVRMSRQSLVWFGALFLALTVTVAPMNGSRSVLFFTAIPVPVVLYEMTRQYGRRAMGFVGIAAAVALTLAAMQTDLVVAWETFLQRVEGATDTEGRAVGLIVQPLTRLGEIGLFGYGAGSTHQAAPVLVGAPNSTWLPTGSGEGSIVRLLIELGGLGLVIVLGLKLYLVYFAYWTMKAARSAFAAVIGTTAFLFLTVHLVAHVAFNPTAGAMYWTLLGTVIYAWSRDRMEERMRRVRSKSFQASAS